MKNQAQFIQKIGKDDKRLIANIGILYLPLTKNMPLNVNSVDCFPLHLCPYIFVKCVPPRFVLEITNPYVTLWKITNIPNGRVLLIIQFQTHFLQDCSRFQRSVSIKNN